MIAGVLRRTQRRPRLHVRAGRGTHVPTVTKCRQRRPANGSCRWLFGQRTKCIAAAGKLTASWLLCSPWGTCYSAPNICSSKPIVPARVGSMMSNGTSSALNSEPDLDSIPMAGGGLSRLAIARLKRAGVPVAPVLKHVGLTPEVIADPEARLSVRSQVALLDEAAIALKDDRLGFTLALDFDPRELGL